GGGGGGGTAGGGGGAGGWHVCGLTGWFGPAPGGDRQDCLNAMVRAIAHRGPDGRGVYHQPLCALGHVRLAIIDPDSGHQPMSDPDGRGVIAYNGEAYNFPALREELLKKGFSFRSRTDTETVLALHLEQGIQGVARLSGMFAYALWEPRARRGWLVRDRQGIKPLFYRLEGERLLFASEAKSLLPALGEKPSLDLDALHLLLNFRYLPGDRTLFSGIFQLPPGGVICWENGQVHFGSLDSFAAGDSEEGGGATGAAPDIEEVRELLTRAVERHLIADVDVGAYLSGGLDSSTLAALVRKKQPARHFPTFTIEAGDRPEEADEAARTAHILDIPNHRQGMPADLGKWLGPLIWHLETPKVNAFQAAAVARLASRHVKVAFSGLGGDELFMGYHAHRFMRYLEPLGAGWALPLRGVAAGMGGMAAQGVGGWLPLPWEESVRGLQMLGAAGTPRSYGIFRNIWESDKARRRLYGTRLLDENPVDAWGELERLWPDSGEGFMGQALAFENQNKLVNDFLWQEDRVSMAFGLESRTPFLDESLWQRLAGVPREQLMPGGRLKGWMREIVSPWLTPEILHRPKSGFQVNAARFFTSHLRPLADQYLSPERLAADGLFNPEFIRQILATPPDRRLRWHYFLLYLMIGVGVWVDLFEKGEQATWR
ncbi:MAG: asparagine synthase (glutamine-hydrolyzing), partial [Magnetococcales bacterium]|nr:asparagine synthase (glutamine-hydrolyzing) [Magnetococcales bacterium]